MKTGFFIWTVYSVLLIAKCIDGSASFLNQVVNYINLVSAYNYHGEYSTVDVIPLEDVSRVMIVNVDLSLLAINGFDEVAGKMDLVVAMNMSWVDEIPLITSADFSVVDRESFLVPYDKIWTPKLVLVNAVGETSEVGSQSYLCSFNMNNYRVTWKPRVVISGSCTPDVTYYPFDKQKCAFTYTGWGFKANEMELTTSSSEWDMTSYKLNGEWDIVETSSETAIVEEQSTITFTIHISRKPLYFAFNIIIPVLLLCCLNSVVFLLPAESGERVGFSITCFLSFMVLLNMVMDIMPRSSSPISYLCFYIVVMMCNSGAMTLVTILLMRVHFKPEKKKVSTWMSKSITFINCGCAKLKCCILIHKSCKLSIKRCFVCLRRLLPESFRVNHSKLDSKTWLKKSSNAEKKSKSVRCKTLLADQVDCYNESNITNEKVAGDVNTRKLEKNVLTKKPKSKSSIYPASTIRNSSEQGKIDTQSQDRQMKSQEPSPQTTFGNLLLQDLHIIFNEEPFINYFRPNLTKRYRKAKNNLKCFSCLRKVQLPNNINSTNKCDQNALGCTEKDISEYDFERKLDTYTPVQKNVIGNHIVKTKPTSEIRSNVEMRHTIDTNKTYFVSDEILLSESESDDGLATLSNADETETISWSEVGRVFDIFFFLVFLGAQIFLTVVFFVPIATN